MLPQLGGRVWSLHDLATGRDLIFANPKLAFANLALTGAWFAGGIEWNLGSTGHSATTCRPVFAGTVDTDRGPLLRLWEWERTRDLVFQVDLMMPEGSPVLLVFIRVRNPDAVPKPLYWWTNTAADERPGVRVLAPATRAWRTGDEGSLTSVEVPFPDSADTDVSDPSSAQRAADYFFEIPADRRAWIAAVETDGRGVVQTATEAMTGRKLFVWGTAAGGRRWQEWLSGSDARYLEIQAGLATTQLEQLRIDGGGEVSWVEAYAPLQADPARAHGPWSRRSPRSTNSSTGSFRPARSKPGKPGGARGWLTGRLHRSSLPARVPARPSSRSVGSARTTWTARRSAVRRTTVSGTWPGWPRANRSTRTMPGVTWWCRRSATAGGRRSIRLPTGGGAS